MVFVDVLGNKCREKREGCMGKLTGDMSCSTLHTSRDCMFKSKFDILFCVYNESVKTRYI